MPPTMIVAAPRRTARRRARLAVLAAACLMTGIGGRGCEQKPASPPPPRAAIEAALEAAGRYFDEGDLDSARAILGELVAQAPRDHRARELHGTVLYAQGLRRAQAGDEAGGRALMGRAADEYDAAVEAAADLEPLVLAGLRQSAGEIAAAAGRPRRALEHFRAAAGLDATNPKHPLYEAQMLLRLDRRPEAEDALRRALRLDPQEPLAHASLAAAIGPDDPRRALEHVARARQLDPGSIAIRVQAARVRRTCGQPRRALELLLALDERTRSSEAIAEEIAACYRRLDDPAGAARAWERAWRPGRWRVAAEAAGAYLDAGDRDDARRWFERAAVAAPDAPEVESLRRRFAAAGG